MMKYNKIQKDFPLSWHLLQSYLSRVFYVSFHQPVGSEYQLCPPSIRDLYEFFDDYGIYVKVDIYFDEIAPPGFKASVTCLSLGIESRLCGVCDTRIESEKTAFEKSFEILEQKLRESDAGHI